MKSVPTLTPEPPTGEHPVVQREMRRELRLNEVKTVAMVVVASLGVVFGAWRILLAEARAQVDGGLAPVAALAGATQRELERFQQEVGPLFTRLEASAQRADDKLDSLLGALRIPNPAPAPARDGGP